MGDPRNFLKMIDDMDGLYSHASEVYEAGKRSGRQEFFDRVIDALRKISVEQESGPVNGPGEAVATRGFHVAQACCKAMVDLKKHFDERKQTV